jgi:hypothetical protein
MPHPPQQEYKRGTVTSSFPLGFPYTKRGVACGEGHQPLSKIFSPSPNILICGACAISLFGEGIKGVRLINTLLISSLTKPRLRITIFIEVVLDGELAVP